MFDATIKKTLQRFQFYIMNCTKESYDTASNMSSIYNGLQAKVVAKNPLAHNVPCYGHSLNLVGEHAASGCSESADSFYMLQQLYNFLSTIPDRRAIMIGALNEGGGGGRVIKSLSITKWSRRDDATKALLESYSEILKALETFRE